MSEKNILFYQLINEASRPIIGWDFSYISRTGRVQTEPLPWSYASIIIPYIRKARSLLDMGTGGGEFFSLLQPFPKHTCATESYEPNLTIAKQCLEPLGVNVVEVKENSHLPFKDNEFELVINRHEAYDVLEIERVLESKGYFITQQVGEKNDIDISKLLGIEIFNEMNEWNAKSGVNELEDNGFEICKLAEAFPITRFYDIGALVFHLKAIPWVVKGFSVEKYENALLQLHNQMQKDGYVETKEHRFLIVAKNQN